MKGSQKKVLDGKMHNRRQVGKNKKMMGGRRLEGHITDLRNTRMGETSRRQRRMEASSEGGQDPEGAVASWMGTSCLIFVVQYSATFINKLDFFTMTSKTLAA